MKLDTGAVKRAMGRKFINGKQLSEEMGLSTTAIYKILRGENQPKVENLQKLCEVLDVNPDEIVKEW